MSKKKPQEPTDDATPPDRHKHTVVSFRPPPDFLEKLRALAKGERRSVAQLVQILLEEAIQAREEKKEGGE